MKYLLEILEIGTDLSFNFCEWKTRQKRSSIPIVQRFTVGMRRVHSNSAVILAYERYKHNGKGTEAPLLPSRENANSSSFPLVSESAEIRTVLIVI